MKTLLSLFLVVTFSNLTTAQTTAIPDPNFEQALINLGLDVVLDGQVLTANISSVTSLSLINKGISDLTGIEVFTALTHLDCQINQLTSLDITQNINLTTLKCRSNQLQSLDVTQNILLDTLECHQNPIFSLDVSQNTALIRLYCYFMQLSSLDVTQNTSLEQLSCAQNSLTWLNLSQNNSLTVLQAGSNDLTCLNVKNGNNNNFTFFSTTYNSSLTCIEVDNVVYSTTQWTNINPQTSFSTNCTNPCLVGIEENSLSNLSLYPNPTTGNIVIDLGEIKQGVKATLTNSLGQVIFTQNYASTAYINLDLDFPKGLYFLTLETDGKVITKKIIKQ